MSSVLHSLLVGAHFRPPAKQVLAHLPAGVELILQSEPGNPYDPGAIAVMVNVAAAVPDGQKMSLDDALTGTGFDVAELLTAEDLLQLGYIISPSNKKLGSWASNVAVGEFMARGPCTAKLAFSAEGEPMVITTLTEERGL